MYASSQNPIVSTNARGNKWCHMFVSWLWSCTPWTRGRAGCEFNLTTISHRDCMGRRFRSRNSYIWYKGTCIPCTYIYIFYAMDKRVRKRGKKSKVGAWSTWQRDNCRTGTIFNAYKSSGFAYLATNSTYLMSSIAITDPGTMKKKNIFISYHQF